MKSKIEFISSAWAKSLQASRVKYRDLMCPNKGAPHSLECKCLHPSLYQWSDDPFQKNFIGKDPNFKEKCMRHLPQMWKSIGVWPWFVAQSILGYHNNKGDILIRHISPTSRSHAGVGLPIHFCTELTLTGVMQMFCRTGHVLGLMSALLGVRITALVI